MQEGSLEAAFGYKVGVWWVGCQELNLTPSALLLSGHLSTKNNTQLKINKYTYNKYTYNKKQ